MYPGMTTGLVYGGVAQVLWLGWLVLQCVEVATPNICVVSWLCFFGFTSIAATTRGELREKFNVWGSPADDFFVGICLYPFCIAQIQMQAEKEEGQPGYFASAEEVIADMSESTGKKGVTSTMVKVDGDIMATSSA